MSARRVWQILLGVATVLWIAFIFANSAKSGAESGADSNSVTQWLNDTVGQVFPSFHISGLFVRKTAHFLEFALLSLLFSLDLALLFSLFSAPSVRERALALLAIPASSVIAMTDEIIQRFTPGRGPSVKDVLLDTAGASFASLLFFGFLCLLLARKRRNQSRPLCDFNL